jgi:hypothetical protein
MGIGVGYSGQAAPDAVSSIDIVSIGMVSLSLWLERDTLTAQMILSHSHH